MLDVVEYKYGKYVKYHVGEKGVNAFIDAVHAFPPSCDDYTNFIVEGVVRNTNCSGLVALTSRKVADLNRAISVENKDAVLEYRAALTDILTRSELLDNKNKVQKPFLHIAIHGMKDRPNKDIEIGTRNVELCSPDVRRWFIEKMREKIDCKIVVDEVFKGDVSLAYHRHGDPDWKDYKGFGDNYNVFQVEISKYLRDNHLDKLINVLSAIIKDIRREFC